MKKLLTLMILFSLTQVFALEIDEKLTSRVLRLSSSKKTMLINRGLEDGLVVGDHAKFFITTGVVARGIIIKASPTRTIWALYRLVNPGEVRVDSVISLKISAPVKLTNDSSKAFGRDRLIGNSPYYSVGDEVSLRNRARGIPVDRSRADLNSMYEDDLDRESKNMSGRRIKQVRSESQQLNDSRSKMRSGYDASDMGYGGTNDSKNIELFALMMIDVNNSTTTTEGSDTEVTSSGTGLEGYLGGEFYFKKKSAWYHKLSLLGFLHPGSTSNTTSNNITEVESNTTSSLLEFGVGLNYHFGADPFAFNRLIGYGGLKLGYGSMTVTSDATEEESAGTTSSYSLGLGGKYYFQNGIGLQMLIEYLTRAASYTFEDSDNDFTTTSSDVAIWAGLSYRF